MSRAPSRASGLLLAALLICGAPVAHATTTPDASQRLHRARVCLAALDFECAAAELDAARTDETTLQAPQRIELHRLSAETALSRGLDADARAHLLRLLALEPTFQPAEDAWPPPWLGLLEEARRQAPDRIPPTLSVEAPSAVEADRAFEVRVRAEDASGVGRVLLHLGTQPPQALVTADGRTWTATIEAALVRPPALELWVEVWDLAGNGPARFHDAVRPWRVLVAPPPALPPVEVAASPPLVRRWWFWTALGAGVAGAATLAVLLSRSGDGGGPVESGLDVELVWPAR